MAQLELMYRVNGGPEQTSSLYGGTPRTDVVAGHTLFLEEMNLQPGDGDRALEAMSAAGVRTWSTRMR